MRKYLRKTSALLIYLLAGNFSNVSASDVDGQSIYFIEGRENSNKTSHHFVKGVGSDGKTVSFELSYGPGEFILCKANKVIYVNQIGEVIQVDVNSLRDYKIGKTTYKPSHEIRNKFIYELNGESFIAAINSVSVDRKVKSFELAKFSFDEKTQILYKGSGHIAALESLNQQTIRIYFAQTSLDFSIKAGQIESGNKSTAQNFDEILLLKSDLLVFSKDYKGLRLTDKVGRNEEMISENNSFLLPLDYSDRSRKLLYVQVKEPGNKTDTDVLFEYDRNKLTKRLVGKGLPIIDACYAK